MYSSTDSRKNRRKMNILKLILYSIAMAIIAKLMGMEQRKTYEKFKENLTMEENPIKITIDNYCGQRVTFTMSEDADVETMFWLDDSSKKVTDIRIMATDKEILIEKEDI